MDSSPVLRQQSQNKIRSDFLRVKNQQNKMPAQPKPFKPQPTPQVSDPNIENKDPENSQTGRKPPVRPGVSRLPVLAKSLHLQTPSDFSQSHFRWEEKPLAGKSKKKRPCTRPVPFNFSQPKSLRVENQHTLVLSQKRTASHLVQPDNNSCNARSKTQNINAASTKDPATFNSNVNSSTGTGKTAGKTPQLPGQSVSSTFKPSAYLSQPLSAVSDNVLHQDQSSTSSAQLTVSAEACLDNMNQLSLKEHTKFSQASQNTQFKSSTEKVESFKPDHAALLSILRNEGVSATGLGPATPQSKPYSYVPQRVSVMKSRQKPGAPSVKPTPFSPDPAALQSILQNEGVKACGPVGATPRNPVRPSGRGTSVFTAQRVPVRKNQSEAAGGLVAVALKETPLKWTPQRVRDTRHQPMSAMKWHLPRQQSLYVSTPGLRSVKTNLPPRQEEVVQRLFDDKEDQQSLNLMEKDPETRAEQLPVQVKSEGSDLKNNLHCEVKVGHSSDESDDDEGKKKEHGIDGRQPFLQAPQRESVIFFSTGKKLLRAPRVEKQESLVHQEQQGTVSSEQTKMLPVHEEKSELSCQISPAVQHRDLSVQKTCSKSPAVALLRKRLPQLEELRLDEEVATYTSATVKFASGFLPHRPRCGNTVASVLHFEEITRFAPISCGLSSGPSSPLSSPLHER